MSKKSQPKTKNLTQEQKTCLLHSVVKYLENNALSKTLKRILYEAQIEVCVVINLALFSYGLCILIYLYVYVCVLQFVMVVFDGVLLMCILCCVG